MTDSTHPAIVADEIRIIVDGAQGVTEQDLSEAIIGQAAVIADLDWRVERLFPDSGDNALLLRGTIGHALSPIETEATALRLRRELSAREDVNQAAVDLPVDAYLPPDTIGAFGLDDLPPETEDPAWTHKLLHVPQAWALSDDAGRPSRGAGIVVAHPDTGYTLHPRLGPNRLARHVDRDFIDNDDDAEDPLDAGVLRNPGHGTATGSVVVGPAVGATHGIGVAPQARLLPLRAIRGVALIFDSDVARAVDWARSRNAHVISMSLGGKGFFGLQRAIQRAVDAGIIVCAAAGNYVGFVTAPASYTNTIAVAGTDFADRPWEGSSRGNRVDVSAPAEAVHVAAFDFDAAGDDRFVVRRSYGTSFAVTHVAGLAALWLAHHGRAALIQRYGASQLVAAFRTLLAGAAVRRPPNWDDGNYGSGVIDAQALLEAELPAADELIAAGALAEPDDAAHRIAAVLGDVDATTVVGQIAATSGFTPQATRAWLARNEDEIVYLLMTEPGLRDVFTPQAGAFSAERPELGQATEAVRSVLGAPPAPTDSSPPATVVDEPEPPDGVAADAVPPEQDTFVPVRPFDREHIDISMVAGDEAQATPEQLQSWLGELDANWTATTDEPGAVMTTTLDPDRSPSPGAFSPLAGDITPHDEIVNAALSQAPSDVGTARVLVQRDHSGVREVRHMTLRGYEIVGSDIRITVTPEGRAQFTGRLLALDDDMDPGPPPPDRPDELPMAVRDQLGLPTTAQLSHEMVVLPTPQGLRWTFKVTALVDEPLADLRIYVDAGSLELLLSHDIALASTGIGPVAANAFASNPGRSRDLRNVSLIDLTRPPPNLVAGTWFDVEPHRRGRFTPANRDFRLGDTDDGFDEPNIYHHLTTALARFVALLGYNPLRDTAIPPLRVQVGHRLARLAIGQYIPSLHTLRFDDNTRRSSLSADIVYHEFAHAITDVVSRLFRSPSSESKGLAEGYADYVACSILDDPRFGDWVTDNPDGARNCAKPKVARFQDVVNPSREHDIGNVWAALLWDLRGNLGSAHTDRMVATSLQHLVPGSSIAAAVNALVTADGDLGGNDGDLIRSVYAARR